ncbi:hypothetical protein OIU34_11795 [Pararhizobium sp. BT-229]|uniref:hypothetical protein n=1 Tax=Pararhizobium sp. BT-229 TaxID=2986923 RepID=UPI0021F71961|nr:hypothetical protein [Pararhizobium sp. BT-229]MCV9962581.1 hypothetical protein [Pararhizobium sp. BT-229]
MENAGKNFNLAMRAGEMYGIPYLYPGHDHSPSIAIDPDNVPIGISLSFLPNPKAQFSGLGTTDGVLPGLELGIACGRTTAYEMRPGTAPMFLKE